MGESLSDAYQQYADLIRHHAYRVVQDHDSAEDILQEVLLRIWRKRDQWSGAGSYTAWLIRITVNISLNHLRTQRRRREDPLEHRVELEENDEIFDRALADSSPGPDAQFERNSEKQLVRDLIQELSKEKREVMELIHQNDYSIGETAEKLGIPDGTVKSRLYYGKRTLAARLRAILRDT